MRTIQALMGVHGGLWAVSIYFCDQHVFSNFVKSQTAATHKVNKTIQFSLKLRS